MADGVILTEQAFLQMKRELAELRREYGNLRRNLSHVSTRRHEAAWPGEAVRFVTASAAGGTVSSASITQWDFSSLSVGNQYGTGETNDLFELTSGYLTALKPGIYWASIFGYIVVQEVRNRGVYIDLALEVSASGSGAWGGQNMVSRTSTNMPDVVTGGFGANMATTHISGAISLAAGDKIRLTTEGYINTGSWTATSSTIGPTYLTLGKYWRATPAPGTSFH